MAMQPEPVQVQRTADIAAGQPRLEAALDQFSDRRARHQGALVALEAQTGEPGLTGQVGGRDAFVDATLEQFQHTHLLFLQQTRLAVGRAQIVRQVQAVQHQLGGLIQRVVVAVPEGQPGFVETAGP